MMVKGGKWVVIILKTGDTIRRGDVVAFGKEVAEDYVKALNKGNKLFAQEISAIVTTGTIYACREVEEENEFGPVSP